MEKIDEFWTFIHQRQLIQYRRYVLKLPIEKWYDDIDPIFKTQKFCNIFPEDDRGSIYIKNETKGFDAHDKILRIVVYRLFNKIETFEAIKQYVTVKTWNYHAIKAILDQIHVRGENIFSGAYICTGGGSEGKGVNKYEMYLKKINDVTVGSVEFLIKEKNLADLKSMHSDLVELPLIGGFVAYVMCQDFTRCGVVSFTMNDYLDANWLLGPKKSLQYLYPGITVPNMTKKIIELRDMSESEFIRLKLDTTCFNGRRLGLLEIENSLCEFSKVTALNHPELGLHGKNRKFVPNYKPMTNESSLW